MKATIEEILATVPKTCPKCGHPTKLSDDMAHLTCTNLSCEGNFARKLEIFAKMFDMDYFGPANCELLSEEISSFHELFDMDKPRLIRLLGQGMGTHVFNNINAHKVVKLEKFLAAICVPKMGPSTGKLFAVTFQTLEAIRKLDINTIISRIQRAGVESATILITGLYNASTEIDELLKRVNVIDFVSTKVGAVLKGERICITGTLSVSREEWKKRIEDNGGQFVSDVTRTTTVLICNAPSNSSKYKNAIHFGVKIETEEWLESKLS